MTRTVQAATQTTGSTLLVLLALATSCDRKGYVSLTVGEIAWLARVKDRQAQLSLAELVRLGEIVQIQPGGGRGNPAVYRITLEWPKGYRHPGRIPVLKPAAKGCNPPKGFST